MSLHAGSLPPIPEETARIARACFPHGTPLLTLAREIGVLFDDLDFAGLYETEGKPALSPARLALVTLFQFMENLSDRDAAEAVRARIDWKYALHLEMDDAGFDHSVLSEFRTRLLLHDEGQMLFNRVLERLAALELVKSEQQRTDSTYVLGAVARLNRLELLAETMRLALGSLAECDPVWLQAIAPAHFYERYSRRLSSFRFPRSKQEQEKLALSIAADGIELLSALEAYDGAQPLWQLSAIATLVAVWKQQVCLQDGQVRWPEQHRPASEMIVTPHDVEVRFSTHHETAWRGYRVHLTESVAPDAPRLITQVETTAATTADSEALPRIQAALSQRGMAPCEQIADQGYISAATLQQSRTLHGIDLVGPVPLDESWQARSGGLTREAFTIDYAHRQARCPEGQVSVSWSSDRDGTITIGFARQACRLCRSRTRCTRAEARQLKLHPDQPALDEARRRARSEAFQERYRSRAGIEGTISVGVRAFALRRSRYIGQAKTHFQELMVAAAMNLERAVQWLLGEHPSGTRAPSLLCLAPCTTRA